MDARYWMTPPPSVLLRTVPSHAVGGNANRNVSTKQSKCLDEAEVRGREIYECAERDMALGSTPRW